MRLLSALATERRNRRERRTEEAAQLERGLRLSSPTTASGLSRQSADPRCSVPGCGHPESEHVRCHCTVCHTVSEAVRKASGFKPGLCVHYYFPPSATGEGKCPGVETSPNRCSCPCEGCKHHCGAHQRGETD